jgi:hypothetical protein
LFFNEKYEKITKMSRFNNIFNKKYPTFNKSSKSVGSLSEACFPEDFDMALKNLPEEKKDKKGNYFKLIS